MIWATFRPTTNNPFDGIDVGKNSSPAFGDIDNDGDLDLVIGEEDGTLNYYENVGGSNAPAYVLRTGAADPFDGIDVGTQSTPALADIDGDRDLDLVIGEEDGTLNFYKNIGSKSSPIFALRVDDDNPFENIDAGTYAFPFLADLTGDGRPELLVGARYDRDSNYYYVNVGSASSPSYALPSGGSGTIVGLPEGFGPPVLVDLDGDGDLDLTWSVSIFNDELSKTFL